MKIIKEINAPRFLIFGYIGIISIGTLLLLTPFATNNGISVIDALFTASSGLCVTGLIVKNTALDFTLFGKCIILALIQIGGLGYMTLSTTFFFFLGRKISLRDRVLFKESINILSFDNLKRFAWRVFRITIALELTGTILLYLFFIRKFNPLIALGHAFFHSVSAFCNAGFSSFSENLSLFSNSIGVPIIAAVLFIIGGLGFIVISDVFTTFIKRTKKRLSLHTIIVLRTTLAFIVFGTVFILVREGHDAFKGYTLIEKLLFSFFQAVTPRTAGFNTFTISMFSPITLLMFMFFMFIGASPGGTGGGIKTTTFVLLLKWIKELLLGRYGDDISTHKKRIPIEQAFRSFVIFGLAIFVVIISFALLLLFDNPRPLKALFEVFSALGTVGLSMGSAVNQFCSFSYDLSWLGKLVIILTMITGRVGTITIGSALLRPHFMDFKYPEEPIVIG
jgi:trk system potassium uptake protein TrkH